LSVRLDIYLTEKKLADSRSRAQWMIENGWVTVNGKKVTKVAIPVEETDVVELTEQPVYISFGGYKLEKAALELQLDFADKTVLDIGASTGGFTDYALKHGAKHVTCIDAGSNQLHPSLRQNEKITVFENTDLRQFSPVQLPHGQPDLVLADLSFISLRKVVDELLKFCGPHTALLVLVKPQFEMEQRQHFKNGIVPPKYHAAVLEAIEKSFAAKGLIKKGVSPTSADGKAKNLEYFLYLVRPV
jgi:23S rRNA (cytidine1920-2'-O)/16S rRNA (cytidine1409-2'-O)-methyltransferase